MCPPLGAAELHWDGVAGEGEPRPHISQPSSFAPTGPARLLLESHRGRKPGGQQQCEPPPALRWPRSPRLQDTARGGGSGAGRCSLGLGMVVAAQPRRCRITPCSTRLALVLAGGWPLPTPPCPSSPWSPGSTGPPRQWVPMGLWVPPGLRVSWWGHARILPSALRPPGLSIAMTSAGAGADARPRILPSWQGCCHSPHSVKSRRQAKAFIPCTR